MKGVTIYLNCLHAVYVVWREKNIFYLIILWTIPYFCFFSSAKSTVWINCIFVLIISHKKRKALLRCTRKHCSVMLNYLFHFSKLLKLQIYYFQIYLAFGYGITRFLCILWYLFNSANFAGHYRIHLFKFYVL